MKRSKRTHLLRMSKRRPKPALEPTCDNHDTKLERKKCHKGKIDPPFGGL